MNTLDAQTVAKLLWDEGVDSDFVIDDERECVALEATCYGHFVRLYCVWGDSDEFFMDVGDVSIYAREEGVYGFLAGSVAECEADLVDEVLGVLGQM